MRADHGKLIAIEGIDQSGKRTQTQLLARRLRTEGFSCSVLNFPDYGTPIGRQLKAYLRGKNRLDMRAVHLLYAANKWEKEAEIRREIKRGRILIVNRYTPSNLAYGVAHGLAVGWLWALEKDLPDANAVMILDVAPRTSFRRKSRLRDVHEGDLAYLKKVRNAYKSLARKYGWSIVDGQRAPADVHSEMWREVSTVLGRRKRES